MKEKVRLPEEKKKEIIEFVKIQSSHGERIVESLRNLGIKRQTYYSWIKPKINTLHQKRVTELTPDEKKSIEERKEEFPLFRHLEIQGILHKRGIYISSSSVYKYLKERGKEKPYRRRESPMKEPRRIVWRKDKMWGCDWTRLRINYRRLYLMILIDLFSRYVISYGIFPSINSSHIKYIYQMGLKKEGISKNSISLPEIRLDRGSPNTSSQTSEFFLTLGDELSFTRVRRATCNPITERFFGTIKQDDLFFMHIDKRSLYPLS